VSPAGIGGAAAFRLWTDTVVPSTRAMGDAMNLAYVPSAPTSAALAFDLAVSSAQILGSLWETGAGAIAAENQALRWLADVAGYPAEAGGVFVQGGTIGNLSALASARSRAATRRDGDLPRRWVLAAGNAAHSSIQAAANVMDVDVLWLDGDDAGRIGGDDLDRAVRDLDDPSAMFALVANAGATNAGIIDDIASLADVCDRSGTWLHVDGAYGLAALASPILRTRFAGIDRADSFVVDPHKWLFAPYDACALLYRDPRWGAAAHAQYAGYLEQIDRDVWNPSDYAIQLSRRARGLPLWFSLATYGTDAYAAAVERVHDTCRAVVAGMRSRQHVEVVLDPDLTVVLFRRPGWTDDRMRAWSDEQARRGTALIITTRWRGELLFRMCFVNPATDPAEVLAVLDTMQ
jgi:glutamate/tyrosine decarboxylase-like PLP-dependent enzyme